MTKRQKHRNSCVVMSSWRSYTRPPAGMKTDQTGRVIAVLRQLSAVHLHLTLYLALSLSKPAPEVSLVRPDPEGESFPAKAESPSRRRGPSSKMEALRRSGTPTPKPDLASPASPASPLPRSKRGKGCPPRSPVSFLRPIE